MSEHGAKGLTDEVTIVVSGANMKNEKEIKLSVAPMTMVKELKKKIANEINADWKNLTLMYNEKTMSDLKVLKDYKLKADKKIKCFIKMPIGHKKIKM